MLGSRPLKEDDYSTWKLLARDYLERAFGKGSPNIHAITDVGRYGSFPMNAGESWWENHRVESLNTQVTKLNGLIELLQTDIELSGSKDSSKKSRMDHPVGNKVFLVHGRDEAVLHQTARFIEQLDLNPVILREQPSEGRTIIEKFTDYSDVGYAVVLLTPDDKGGLATTPFENYLSRARQNVIFELGYMIGKIGRNRVCALFVSGVEIPSDYNGVAFVPFDESGGWKLTLAKEMKAAGLAVDMNKAL